MVDKGRRNKKWFDREGSLTTTRLTGLLSKKTPKTVPVLSILAGSNRDDDDDDSKYGSLPPVA
jgi:hypothetical protein